MKTEPSVHNSSGTCLNLMKVNNKRHLEINTKNNQSYFVEERVPGSIYRWGQEESPPPKKYISPINLGPECTRLEN